MKKQHLLKSMLLLCALVVGSSSVWADETYTLGWGSATGAAGTYTNFTDTSGSVEDIVSFTTAQNQSGNAPAYNSSDKELRLYYHSGGNGCSVTLTPALGVTITGAVITATSNYTPTVKYKVNNGSLTTASLDGTTYTISSISATSSLFIQNANTVSKQFRIKTIQISYTVADIPEHTATFNINGATTSNIFKEGASITFPSDPDIDGLDFVGWTTAAIVGTQNTAPDPLVTSDTMGDSNITYYAVFAKKEYQDAVLTKTITSSSTGFPSGGYSDNAECTFDGVKYNVNKAMKSTTKMQWQASNGAIYNKEAINKIQSIVITYDSSDSEKNFTLKVGNSSNPSSGTAITPTSSSLVYTFDCSTYEKDYFLLKNGTTVGYLTTIDINYLGKKAVYSAYRTSIPAVNVSISSAKYATFCDEVARNFDGKGITVYMAKSDGSKVNLTEVEDGIVPANKGVVLYSASVLNDVDIPVATTDASDYSDSNNEMVGITARTQVNATADTKTNYILSNESSGVGFYKASGGYLAANKAYLSTTTAASARDFLGFEENTTAIESITNSKEIKGEYFNLNGQRVVNPTKGLYIVKGKKVIK